MSTSLTLRDVTASTVRAICALEVAKAQRDFVAPNAVSIAEAHFAPSACFKAIYADETPVGFVMWRPAGQERTCHLWRFMIDARHQGQGHGRAALAALFQNLRAEGFERLSASYVPGDAGPRGFYAALGFEETGEIRPNGERVVARTL